MPRSVLVVTSVVLALFSPLTQAKVKDQLRTYFFTSDDCNGPTMGGNKDIKLHKCHDIISGANSVRAFTNKHQDWLAHINNGEQRCYLNTYQYLGCKGTPTAVEELPHAIDECITSDQGEQILSVLFGCEARGPTIDGTAGPIVVTETKPGYLTTWMHTSNSLTTIVSSVMTTTLKTLHPTTSTVTVLPASTVTVVSPPAIPVQTVTVLPTTVIPIQTITVLPNSPVVPVHTIVVENPPVATNTVTVYVEEGSQQRVRRSDPQPETHDLEARRKSKWKGPRIGVWMKHPWSQAVICYECYAKAPDNTFKFECRSGPKNPVHCKEPMPNPDNVVTITHTPATVTASPAITSVSVVTVTAGQPLPGSPPAITQSVFTMVGGKPITTIIDQSLQTITLSQKEVVLDPRDSFHRAVRFTHPWFPGTEMCADAEWEGRGKDRGEIRIQKPKTDMKKCEKDHQVQKIDAFPKTSTYELPTRTVSMIISTSTVYPEPAVTVIPAPSVVTVTVDPASTVTVTTAPAPVYSTVTTIIDPAPEYTTVTTIFDPAPEYTTVTTIFDPAPAYSVTTITMDAEPARSTVTVVPGFAPTSYTTIYQDRRQLRDL